MRKPLGHVCELVRYPVKSMAGTATESAFLGWHGLAGDRRFAFQRPGSEGGSRWLSASRVPELVLYHPVGFDERGAALMSREVALHAARTVRSTAFCGGR